MAIAFLFFSPSVALLSLLSPLVLGPAGERKKARHARKKARLLASGDIASLLKTFNDSSSPCILEAALGAI